MTCISRVFFVSPRPNGALEKSFVLCPDKYCASCLSVSALWGSTRRRISQEFFLSFLELANYQSSVTVLMGWFGQLAKECFFFPLLTCGNLSWPIILVSSSMHCSLTLEFGNPFFPEISWGFQNEG